MATHKIPEIIFQDDCLLAVNKPSGLLSVPDRWDRDQENLQAILRSFQKQKIYVVHRLDQGTSGIILFAKTGAAHKNLSLQFQGRLVHKEYLALASGVIEQDKGSWTFPIAEDPRTPGKRCSDPSGKPAQTDFSVLERFDRAGYTWVSLAPRTGRTHQIRVHLACAGHPVVGDTMYGAGDKVLLSVLKKGYRLAPGKTEKPLLNRLALHAKRLRFCHPDSGQELCLEAPLPKDLEITLRYLHRLGR